MLSFRPDYIASVRGPLRYDLYPDHLSILSRSDQVIEIPFSQIESCQRIWGGGYVQRPIGMIFELKEGGIAEKEVGRGRIRIMFSGMCIRGQDICAKIEDKIPRNHSMRGFD